MTELVAELSANHLGSLDRALALVTLAKDSGADAVKLQTWTRGTMTAGLHLLTDGPWAGRDLTDLYDEAYTPWEWHAPIFARASELGIGCFASVFDAGALAFLEDLGCPRYKIASFELLDIPLIRAVASTGKPIILSTGMATWHEILEAHHAAVEAGAKDITVLRCTSAYPATAADANLETLFDMDRRLGCKIGLSDHTKGIGVAVVAAAMGASMIEKHFTFSRSDGGPDAAFSLEPQELRALVEECRRVQGCMGRVTYGPKKSEAPQLALRRSVFATADIKIGDLLTDANVGTARPCHGMHPRHMSALLGRRSAVAMAKGTPIRIYDTGEPGGSA